MLSSTIGRGIGKVFTKSAEVFFHQSIKLISNLLPSPSEYRCIECLLYNIGYYKRTTFTLYINITNINLIRSKYKYELEVKTGEDSECSRPFSISNAHKHDEHTLKLVIRPWDVNVTIDVIEKKPLVSTTIASINIEINNDIINRGYPKNKRYIVLKRDKNIGDLTLSFHSVPCRVNLEGELWNKAVIKYTEQEDAEIERLEDPGREDKLEIMSALICGRVCVRSPDDYGWKQMYFKVVKIKDSSNWDLHNNDDKGQLALSIPMLAIKCVTIEGLDIFKITYVKEGVENELICKHNLAETWAEASNMYIQMLRRHLEHLPLDLFTLNENKEDEHKNVRIAAQCEGENLPKCINEMYNFMEEPKFSSK